MKPYKSADYFIKVNFYVVVEMEQSESYQSVNFSWERFFNNFIKNYML